MAAVGVAIAAPIIASTKIFAEYEQSMAKVQAVSGATEAEFKALDAIARKMGRTTVFTARESAEALTFMSMAGMEAHESIAALPHVLNLAAAGQLELGAASDIVTNVMAGYGLATEDLGMAVDVLTKGFTSANTDLGQLGEAFAYAGPVASAAGIQFEETAAALALMGNAGFQSTMAGTALRGAITRLLNPTAKAEQILLDMGITVLDTEGKMRPLVDIVSELEAGGLTAGDAMTIFGQRAGPAMLALVSQGSESLRDLTMEMENAGGTAQEIADTQLNTLNGDILLLKSAFEGIALTIRRNRCAGAAQDHGAVDAHHSSCRRLDREESRAHKEARYSRRRCRGHFDRLRRATRRRRLSRGWSRGPRGWPRSTCHRRLRRARGCSRGRYLEMG